MPGEKTLKLVYAELRQIAGRLLNGEDSCHTLQSTALVHEAFWRIRESRNVEYLSTGEFCAALSNVMRRILVDHARRKRAEKRGRNWVRVDLETAQLPAAQVSLHELLDLDQALSQLESKNARQAAVVKLRFYSALTIEETAVVLEVSPATVKNDWRVAREWLLARLQAERDSTQVAAVLDVDSLKEQESVGRE